MRVLHLIDATSPQACSTTFAMIGDAYGRLGAIDQQIMLLGGDAIRNSAHNAGLHDTIHVGVPGGRAVAGWWRVPQTLKARAWTDLDVIHAWSIGAFTLASMRFRHVPRLLTLTTLPTARQVKWLRVLTRDKHDRVAILPISNTIRRALLQGGISEQVVHVLRPAIDMSRIERTRRPVRERWGITSETDERTRVIALLSDPPTASDLSYAMSIANTYVWTPDSLPIRLIAHPDQRNIHSTVSLLRELEHEAVLITDERIATPWQILSGCDLALAIGHDGPVEVHEPDGHVTHTQMPHGAHPNTGSLGASVTPDSGGGGLSLLWAMAANIPIVGEATYGISEIVEDRHSALLARPGNVRALAHRVGQVLTDQQLAWSLRDMAHHEAFSFFSRRRYCDALTGIYPQHAAGKPVEIPEMEATGGMRFTGRG